jgi:2-methylcitrate dehydratase PrpD
MIGHPSAVLVPAVLAVAEDIDASGYNVLEAFIVGFEVAARLGRALNPSHYERGWHATGTLGAPAVAAAVAHLLRLDAPTTQTALAIAASLAAGLRASFGTMVKPLHAGHAARTGVLAARLAAGGFSAAPELFEAPRGFGSLLSAAPDWEAVLSGWSWSEPEILHSGIQLKPFPSCAMTHTAIDALLSLRSQLRADEVVGLEVCVTPLVPQILIHSRPTTGLEGKFSMEYCLAVTLLDGQPGVEQFSDERLVREDVQQLLRRVEMRVDPSLPEDLSSGRMPVKVSARLADGQVVSMERELPPGAPQRQLTRDQLEQKFRSNASGVAGDAQGALDALATLRSAVHVSAVLDRLAC